MKAMVLLEKGRLVYTDVPEPAPFGVSPVLVRVAAVGVCGSDILRFAQGKAYHFPLVLGHEFSAVVEEAPASSAYSVGDRVAVYPLLPDYSDPFSRTGDYHVSSGYDYFGSRRDGAFGELLYVPEANLIRIPDSVPLVHAAVAEPAAVALHAVRKFRLPANATALVIGGGPVGALAAQWLRIMGCCRVFVADVDEKKCAILSAMGFEVIHAGARDTIEAVMEATGGRGVDCAVEGCGIPRTFVQAIQAASVFGQVLFLGDVNGDVHLEDKLITTILRRELTLYGTWNSKVMPPENSEWDMVLAHMGRSLQVAPLISHTPLLEQGPQMFSDMASRAVWYNKVVFAVSEAARSEIQQI
jgi:L-iditol 2-dehydrogenase